MGDFESELSTILAAITWTNCTTQPSTCYGDTTPLNPLAYLRVRNEAEDIEEGLTYAGSIAYRNQKGTIEGFARTATSRDKMVSDLEAGLGPQGVFISNKVENTYQNIHGFYMDLQRIE